MNKLEEIRKRNLSFDKDENEYLGKDIAFLIRAVEQLVRWQRVLTSTDDAREQTIAYDNIFDPDIRELVESDL